MRLIDDAPHNVKERLAALVSLLRREGAAKRRIEGLRRRRAPLKRRAPVDVSGD
jgi:hypothetical protein